MRLEKRQQLQHQRERKQEQCVGGVNACQNSAHQRAPAVCVCVGACVYRVCMCRCLGVWVCGVWMYGVWVYVYV